MRVDSLRLKIDFSQGRRLEGLSGGLRGGIDGSMGMSRRFGPCDASPSAFTSVDLIRGPRQSPEFLLVPRATHVLVCESQKTT